MKFYQLDACRRPLCCKGLESKQLSIGMVLIECPSSSLLIRSNESFTSDRGMYHDNISPSNATYLLFNVLSAESLEHHSTLAE